MKKILSLISTFQHLFITPYVSFSSPFVVILMLSISMACTNSEPVSEPPPGGGGETYPELRTNAEALANFQDMRFGMFVHWGPVDLKGTEIGWSRGREIPISTYDSLYLQFNPTESL